MSRWRKKPVVVEAWQTDHELVVETLEGPLKASPGDFIITGVKGEVYPCKPDIFAATYEAADEPEQPPLSRDEERTLESFDYHKPSDEQVERIATVRRTCKAAAHALILTVQPCADRTVALRKLHEAMMNANKAIVCEESRARP